MKDIDRKYRLVTFWVLATLACAVAALMLKPFFPAILLAIVLSVLTRPIYDRLNGRMSSNFAALLTTVGTILLIGIPIFVIGAILFVQVNGFVHQLQSSAQPGQNVFDPSYLAGELDKMFGDTVKQFSKTFTFQDWYATNKAQFTTNLTQQVRAFAVSAGTAGFMLVVGFLTMFFILRDGKGLREPTLRLLPLAPEKSNLILDRLDKTIHAVFISVFMVGIVQGLLAGASYWIAGVPNALMWTVATIVLCMIPLLGAPIVYIPVGLILLAEGKTAEGIGVLAFCFLIVSNIDNLLKPWIIGARVDLHPMAVFFALLGGILFFGPIGLMAGPIVLTLVLALQEVIIEMRNKGEALGLEDSEPEPG